MAEAMTAVWGVYNREGELVMLKPYDCTETGWPDGYAVRRLPLATPAIGRVVEASLRLDSLRLGNTPAGMSRMEFFLSTGPEYQRAVDEHIAACGALRATIDAAITHPTTEGATDA